MKRTKDSLLFRYPKINSLRQFYVINLMILDTSYKAVLFAVAGLCQSQ